MCQRLEDAVSKPRVAEVRGPCSVPSGHEIHPVAAVGRDHRGLALQAPASPRWADFYASPPSSLGQSSRSSLA